MTNKNKNLSKHIAREYLKNTVPAAKILLTGEDVMKITKNIGNDKFSNKMVNDTKKYQKKYGFDAKEGNKDFSTHNNQADAFKHTYMQAG